MYVCVCVCVCACVCACACVYVYMHVSARCIHISVCSWPFSSPHIITDPPVLNIFQSSVKIKIGEVRCLVLQCSFMKHTNDLNSFPSITWTDSSD